MITEQLKGAINAEYESIDAMKTALTNFIPNIETVLSENKTQRKDLGSKLDASLAKIESIGKAIGLENPKEFSDSDIAEKLKSYKDDKTADYDKKLADELEGHKKSFNEELEKAQQTALEATNKLTQFEHKSLIESSGLLKDVRDDTPLFKQQAMDFVMSQTIVQDGKLFASNDDGKPAMNYQSKSDSDKYLGGDFVVSNMKDNAIYAPLFKSEQKANGMGVNPNQNNSANYSHQTRTSLSKISDGLKK